MHNAYIFVFKGKFSQITKVSVIKCEQSATRLALSGHSATAEEGKADIGSGQTACSQAHAGRIAFSPAFFKPRLTAGIDPA
jgi:hypothetical protein